MMRDVAFDPWLYSRIREQHFTSQITQQTSTQSNDDGEFFHQFQHQGAAEYDQWDTDCKANDQQDQVTVRSSCDAQHIVEAHDEIGDQNGFDSAPQIGVTFNLFFFSALGQQLDTDVKQSDRADQFEIWQGQQLERENGQNNTQDDGGGTTVQHGQTFLFGG